LSAAVRERLDQLETGSLLGIPLSVRKEEKDTERAEKGVDEVTLVAKKKKKKERPRRLSGPPS